MDRSVTAFKDLPLELRNQIWIFSLPNPRIIALREYRQPVSKPAQDSSIEASSTPESQDTTPTSPTNDQEGILVYRTRTRIPALYSVCWESRVIFERFYTKAFQTPNSPGIWIDFENDSLYLDYAMFKSWDDETFYETFPQDIRLVRNLVISGLWGRKDDEQLFDIEKNSFLAVALRTIGNLQSLLLVEALHETDPTAALVHLPIEVEPAVEYRRWLQSSAHSSICVGEFTHPWIGFGVLKDFFDFYSGQYPDDEEDEQDQGLPGKVRTWRKRFKSIFSTRWRIGRSTL